MTSRNAWTWVWWSGACAGAWAQLRLPTTDGRGEPLAVPDTVATVVAHQQIVIYLLMAVLVLSILANVWIATLFLRAQYTLERMAEAIRRVDLLAEAFRVANVAWQEEVSETPDATVPALPVVDLDDMPRYHALRRRS